MKTTVASPNKGLVLAAFAAIYLIWGSTYVAILFGLQSIPPFLLSGLRFFLAGIALLLWQLAAGERAAWRPTLQHALAGILMLSGGTGAVVWVEQHISSGLAAIIVASMPFWFVLLDYRQWSFNFSNGLILGGVVVGFSGILLLFGAGQAPEKAAIGAEQVSAVLFLLAGCLCWATGSLYVKYHPGGVPTVLSAGIQMTAAGFFSTLLSGALGEWKGFSFGAVSTPSWLGLAYLICFGSLLGYLSYVWLLRIRPAVQVGTYAYINPVVAILLGWMIAAEPFSWPQLVALGVILAGVLLINLPKYKGWVKRISFSG